MRILKAKAFMRFANKAGIADSVLCRAIRDAERGLISADLGGGVIKQRIARPGEGKSGGFRTLVVFRVAQLAVFVHGFAKNERDNVENYELVALKKLAREFLAYDDVTIARVIATGAFVEVNCDQKTIS